MTLTFSFKGPLYCFDSKKKKNIILLRLQMKRITGDKQNVQMHMKVK